MGLTPKTGPLDSDGDAWGLGDGHRNALACFPMNYYLTSLKGPVYPIL